PSHNILDIDQDHSRARAQRRHHGHLLVVAMVRPSTHADHLCDVANALSNPLIVLAKHPRPVRGGAEPEAVPMPVREASTSLAELRSRAQATLPGVVIRRREGFRVTLHWQRPAAGS